MRRRSPRRRDGIVVPVRVSRSLAFSSILILGVSACSDSPTAPSAAPLARVEGSALASTRAAVLSGAGMWVNRYSNAQKTGEAWWSSRRADAERMFTLAAAPQVQWFGNWNADVRADVDHMTTLITNAGKVPVYVAYNIPQRDCGGLSANTTSVETYKTWITALADGIGWRKAAVILEPDALAGIDCLDDASRELRYTLLNFAVTTLMARGQVDVYLDGGHPYWQSAATMAERLNRAGIANARGFALNVSNFISTADNIRYGDAIRLLTGGKRYVIDTGRNGRGPTSDYQWCNPDGRALGDWPTTNAWWYPNVDALLWVKPPGESDGACNGAPASGTWMPEYALELARRAAY